MIVAPVWCDRKDVKRVAGVTDAMLNAWLAEGRIGWRKLGESRQSRRIFRFDDVLRLIERLDGADADV